MLLHHHLRRSRGPANVPPVAPSSAPDLVRLHRLALQEEQSRHAAEVARLEAAVAATESAREDRIRELEAENRDLRARLERKGR